ncbi:hypothetical protein [Marinilactibacillus kalidii]|uniref:hypothetical protein n=1 Tax=Marinilactibacillus kalidii TaxID=2820274 RepID=UPI001ABEC135|nr:hypothetical protein [Marinilactibacillus kalidii]
MIIPSQMTIGSLNQLAPDEETKKNSDLDMEQFLTIISKAMSMPSLDGGSGGSGGNETDYIGQMVQFGMLNSMQELTDTMQTTMLMTQQQQAVGMVGKQVTLKTEADQMVSGAVEKVRFDNGYATVQVNGTQYALNNIIEVGA